MPQQQFKRWYKSKINVVGALTILAGIGAYSNLIPKKYAPAVLIASGLAAAVLRTFFTNTMLVTPDGTPTTKPAPPQAGG